jgi:twitching motility protein PilT
MPAIDILFDKMLTSGASDLHLAEGQPPKLRLHGEVVPIDGMPVLGRDQLGAMMREICEPDRWERYEAGGDLDYAHALGDRARFRVNFLRQYAGYGAVFRVIPSRILSLDELGCPPILKTFSSYNSGLVLVTGPTGSGKSTTLAAVIDDINTSAARHILTIEEPVEFVHPIKKSAICQREVGRDAISFGAALQAATRQDVDVILVGEMRDLETISLAVTAAETGTLVFGTLHTNSAVKTVDRIIDVFPADQQGAIRQSLAVALRAICAQLLLRRCDRPGRIAVHEILIQTAAASNSIREAKNYALVQVIMSNKALGMQLMDDCIQDALTKGIIDGEQAYLKANDKERFKQYSVLGQG